MNSARSSGASVAPCGCLRPSRCVPVCGPGAFLVAGPIETPRPSSARHPSGALRWSPAHRHRWLRVLLRGDRSLLWFRVRLWAGAQDSEKRSGRPGRAAPEDRHDESAEDCAVGVGGFRDPEHLVRRASQPDDSSRVGVLAPALAMPRPGRRPAPRARRALAVLLQFHPAAQGVAVRSRDSDASDAGRFGEQAIGLERHLHGLHHHAAYSCSSRARFRDRPAHGL